MFITIKRLNSYGEELPALINSNEIVAIKQAHQTTTKLYDSYGNLAQETPNPIEFVILFSRGETYHISQSEYDNLVNSLTTTK